MERKEALAAKMVTYNTGRPCRVGHHADRYAKNGACVECLKKSIFRSAELPELKEIYIFSKTSGYAALKLNIDALIAARYPDAQLDVINPMPFNGKQVSRETYQIKVKVPHEDVALMYKLGELLREKE